MPKRSAQKTQVSPLVGHIFFAGGSGLAVTFLFLLFSAWLFTKTQLPAWSAVPLATAAVSLGCFISGHVLSRRVGQNGLFCGLCCGVCFYLLYLLAALLNGQFDYSALAGIKLVCYVLSGCIGGFLGILAYEKAKHPARH